MDKLARKKPHRTLQNIRLHPFDVDFQEIYPGDSMLLTIGIKGYRLNLLK